jgi:hypothetical protein
MARLVKYKGEYFIQARINKDGTTLIFTKNREKGLKFGFEEKRYDRFELLVDPDELEIIKIFKDGSFDKYRVKYRDHYFRVFEETEDEVLIYQRGYTANLVANLYEMDFSYYDSEAKKWVSKREITDIRDITDKRLGLYEGIVCQIVEEKDEKYKIESNMVYSDERELNGDKTKKQLFTDPKGFEKIDNTFQKWIPKESIYVYNESDEPIRY